MNGSLFVRLVMLVGFVRFIPDASGSEPSKPLERLAEFRFFHPEILAARINGLFDGAKAPHPAAALSAWKRATVGKGSLGKPLEAVIAMFNPEMAREWRSLDGAVLTFWETTDDPPAAPRRRNPDWSITIPKDDGTVAAFLIAGRLTGGTREGGLSGLPDAPVERLGPPGAPFSARVGRTPVIAGSPASLRMAVARGEAERNVEQSKNEPPTNPVETKDDSETPGIRFTIEGGLLNALALGTQWSRPIGELVRAVEDRRIEGFASLVEDELQIRLRSLGGNPGSPIPLRAGPVEPEWLDWIPRSRSMAAVVLRVDPVPATWDFLFTLMDRIEKTDPTKAGTVPVRMRFNLLLGAARVRPEIDLWPHLQGVTASVVGDPRRLGEAAGGLIALHLDEESAAKTVREVLAPRIAETYAPGGNAIAEQAATLPPKARHATEPSRLGVVGTRPLWIAGRGRTVLLGWGVEEPIVAALAADERSKEFPSRFPNVEAADLAASRIALIWPGRFDTRIVGKDPDSPTRRVLADAAPIVWVGGANTERTQLDDRIVARGLRSFVARFLESVPLEELDRR